MRCCSSTAMVTGVCEKDECLQKVLNTEVLTPAYGHRGHLCGFSPECFLKCDFREQLVVKMDGQISHLYDLSSVCILQCVLKVNYC